MVKYDRLKTSIKVYNLWPGNNSFHWDGTIMLGPTEDRKVNVLAWIVNITIFTINFFFFGRFFTNQVAFLPWLGLYQYIIVCICFLVVQLTDPGIIPAKKIQLLLFDKVLFPYNIGSLTYSEYLNSSQQDLEITQKKFRTQDDMEYSSNIVLSESQFQDLKDEFIYCKTCEIYRPPKASHCRVCNNCIEMNDHHCQFVRNCIGRRNFTMFVIFTIQTGVLMMICQFGGIYFLKYIVYWMMGSDNSRSGYLVVFIRTVCYILFVFSIFLLASMIFLITLQTYLWKTGKTTKELYRNQDKKLSRFMEQKYDIIRRSKSLINGLNREISSDEFEVLSARERLTNVI